jgi:pilus assembly protein CpaB
MKKIIPIILAVIAFVVVIVILRPAPSLEVVVAARDLTSGHTIESEDVTLERIPKELVPSNAFFQASDVVGKTLSMNRTQGDLILPVHLGEAVALQPDERAIAVKVVDATGLAGLLREGDRVGVTVTLLVQGTGEMGAFSKVAIENLRVLYLSPEFRASDPMSVLSTPDPLSASGANSSRAREGAVVLAVPVTAQAVAYDLAAMDPSGTVQSRTVNALELLSAVGASENAQVSLYLMPPNANPFTTSGLWLPDLIVRLTPTPTPTPVGWTGGGQP